MTISVGTNFVILQTLNRSGWVCAEGGGGHEVVANRPAAGTWETWKAVWTDDAHDSEDSTICGLICFNGQFMTAEGGGGGDVNANRNVRGPWETFQQFGKRSGSAGFGGTGITFDTVSFQTVNGNYLSSDGGGVERSSPTVQPWGPGKPSISSRLLNSSSNKIRVTGVSDNWNARDRRDSARCSRGRCP
jgi:hypothetical protein